MLLIPCPWCGPRDESEFTYRGEVIIRPDPQRASDGEWTAFLFHRTNPRGWLDEQWLHIHGCAQLVRISRNTVTNEIK